LHRAERTSLSARFAPTALDQRHCANLLNEANFRRVTFGPPASGNAYRKSFLDKIMPIADEELYRRSADGYTTGLAGIAGRVVSIPHILAYYRIHGDNYGGESGVKSIPHLHHMFMRDVKREGSAHAFGDQFNFHFSADRSRYCPGDSRPALRKRCPRLVPP
jgi:hypothetical protein